MATAHIIIPWAFFVVLAGLLLFKPAFYRSYGDPDEWLYVESMTVEEHDEHTLEVCVRTEIGAPFSARWRATVRSIQPDGASVFFAKVQATSVYDYAVRPMSSFCLPWNQWTGMPVPIEPGIYQLHITWPMVADDGAERTQRAVSNLFRVGIAPDPGP